MGGQLVYDEPGSVHAVNGVVLLDGPDGVAITLTPRSAEETGNRLIAAARTASGQRGGAGSDPDG